MAAVLWGAARRGPRRPSGRVFRRPPPPSEGTRAAAKQRYQSPPREEEEPEPQPRPRWTRRASPHLSPGPAGFGGEPGRGPRTLWARRWPPTKVGAFLRRPRARRGVFRGVPGPGQRAGGPPRWARRAPGSVASACGASAPPRGRPGLAAASRSRRGPLLRVPCPRGRPTGSARPVRLSPVSARAVGSGSACRVPRPRGAQRPGRPRLLVSFFFDRNGVIVGAGKTPSGPDNGDAQLPSRVGGGACGGEAGRAPHWPPGGPAVAASARAGGAGARGCPVVVTVVFCLPSRCR